MEASSGRLGLRPLASRGRGQSKNIHDSTQSCTSLRVINDQPAKALVSNSGGRRPWCGRNAHHSRWYRPETFKRHPAHPPKLPKIKRTPLDPRPPNSAPTLRRTSRPPAHPSTLPCRHATTLHVEPAPVGKLCPRVPQCRLAVHRPYWLTWRPASEYSGFHPLAESDSRGVASSARTCDAKIHAHAHVHWTVHGCTGHARCMQPTYARRVCQRAGRAARSPPRCRQLGRRSRAARTASRSARTGRSSGSARSRACGRRARA